MPAARIDVSGRNWLRLLRSILRLCPNTAEVIFSSVSRCAGAIGCARGSILMTAESTFGGGTNDERDTLNRILALVRHCARTESRP